jgi:hypothetical protein
MSRLFSFSDLFKISGCRGNGDKVEVTVKRELSFSNWLPAPIASAAHAHAFVDLSNKSTAKDLASPTGIKKSKRHHRGKIGKAV